MRVSRWLRLTSLPIAIFLVVVRAAPLAAGAAQPDSVSRRGPMDRAELEAFLDGVIGAEPTDRHIAGATVAVVRDGGLLLSKGYGFADVAARVPVDPARTLFRIGSVSKLFTWTAVMQLVEQGKLDLDADVNGYLDFRIPATYPEPITLRHLLTHTAGFEDDNRGMEVQDPAALQPMDGWLPAHEPARVRPPGTFSSYSNWGAALAGYIVQRVSGQPFETCLEEHLLAPLGMHRTTGRQPLPAALAGVRILEPATAEAMHAHQFGGDPRVNGWGLGFYEQSSHGLRIIGHGGGSAWFHTDLSLIPAERLGLIVSFNTATGADLAFGRFLDLFLDHYYPVPPPPVVPQGDLARFAGSYLFNRRSYTTFQKALTLPAAVTIGALGDSALLVSLPFGDAQRAGHPCVPQSHAVHGARPAALVRAPRLHLAVLGGGLAVSLGVLLAAAGRWVRRWRGALAPASRTLARGRLVVGLAGLANVLFAMLFALAMSDQVSLMSDSPRLLNVALALPLVALALVLAGAWIGVRLWRERSAPAGARWRHWAVVATGLAFGWSLWFWNLLGWRG